jgi:hypothetical protein
MRSPLIRHGFVWATVFMPIAVAAQEPSSPPRPPACIAVVLPSVQGVEGDATAIGASLRDLFASFLKGPSLEVVRLESRLASHAFDEARLKQCPLVLTATMTRKRDGGGGGHVLGNVIGQAGSSAAWGLPMGSVGAAAVRGATVATTQAIGELASSTKARDEVRLDYKLTAIDGKAVLVPKTDKAKAQADGEDLLTPMVERAAEAIVAAAR